MDINLIKQVYGSDPEYSLLKTIIETASPIIVIALFIIERILSRNVRRNDLEIAWYYKIMIEPNSKKIDSFFESIIVQYKDSVATLKKTLPNAVPQQKSQIYGTFSDVKRRLEIEVIQHFYMSYRHVATQLTNILNELQDLYTQNIDAGIYNNDTEEKMSRNIYSMKAMFYECLLEPIENTKLSKKQNSH